MNINRVQIHVHRLFRLNTKLTLLRSRELVSVTGGEAIIYVETSRGVRHPKVLRGKVGSYDDHGMYVVEIDLVYGERPAAIFHTTSRGVILEYSWRHINEH